jgi:enoyl-CoA hydratase/carnithine racemase
MTQALVLYETDAKVGFVTLNRPEKLNALSTDLRRELAATLTRADEDPATSVVVLRGAGRSFCVGYDLAGGSGGEAWRHDALKYHERLGTSLALELMPWYMRKPVLASVQGHALGAGCELAMFCDLTIAADDAMFGEPESRYSQSGPGFVMPWIIGFKKARELLYLGDMIDAPTALGLGMVNRMVPRDSLSDDTLKFARRMALIAPEALRPPSSPSIAVPTPPAFATRCRPASTWSRRSMPRRPRSQHSSANSPARKDWAPR